MQLKNRLNTCLGTGRWLTRAEVTSTGDPSRTILKIFWDDKIPRVFGLTGTMTKDGYDISVSEILPGGTEMPLWAHHYSTKIDSDTG